MIHMEKEVSLCLKKKMRVLHPNYQILVTSYLEMRSSWILCLMSPILEWDHPGSLENFGNPDCLASLGLLAFL